MEPDKVKLYIEKKSNGKTGELQNLSSIACLKKNILCVRLYVHFVNSFNIQDIKLAKVLCYLILAKKHLSRWINFTFMKSEVRQKLRKIKHAFKSFQVSVL